MNQPSINDLYASILDNVNLLRQNLIYEQAKRIEAEKKLAEMQGKAEPAEGN